MATLDEGGIVTQEELMISSLVMGDAVTELLIEKGLITRDEFMQKLSAMISVSWKGRRKSRGGFMKPNFLDSLEVRRELEQRLDALAREYHETRDPKIKRQLESLSKRLAITPQMKDN
jgi:hypothetical protein